ncbi:MAG: parallel beta-helix repeat protein [Paracoccaceae bacterium]|jgi:parallel beta-helix repeat protein
MAITGFWSYARGDDDHLDHELTQLRKRIAGEVSMLLGRDVDMFQDILDLRTGDRWEDKLRGAVASSAFLMPVLTPRYFNRPWCREETLTFLRLAKEKGVEPLIFPIRFVEYDAEDGCEVRTELSRFQYKDFAGWRFESDPTERSRMVNSVGKHIKARLKAIAPLAVPPAPVRPKKDAAAEREAAPEVVTKAPPVLPPKSTHKTFSVDPMPGRGDFTRVQEAIDAAPAGSRILIRPGTYREALQLLEPLELVGEGDRDRIVIMSSGGPSLVCVASMARVTGVSFRAGRENEMRGVVIGAGSAEFEDCLFSSDVGVGLFIMGSETGPTIRRCIMSDNGRAGISVSDGAKPLIEDCEILRNRSFGVSVGDPGTVATFRRCIVRKSGASGYRIDDQARAFFDGCEAAENAHAGVMIADGGEVSVRNCTISNNSCEAVWVFDAKSGGTFENNDLRGNAGGSWDIAPGAEANITRTNNLED